MKARIQKYFALTDQGINNTIKASIFSFLKFFSFTFSPILVFMFLQDYLRGELKSLTIYMAILTTVVVIMYFILRKEYILTYDTTYEESTALRENIANQFKRLPLSYFSKHNLSDLSQTIMMDVNNIEMVISHALPQGIGFLYFFILISVLMILSVPLMGLAVVVPIWLAMFIMFFTGRAQTSGVRKYYKTLLENAASFQEAFEMQQEIKSYSMQGQVEKDVSKKLEDSEKIHIKAEFTMAFMSFLIGLLPYLAPVLTAVIGAMLFTKGEINILYYVGYLMAATTISSQYAAVNEYILMALFFEDSFKRIRELREEKIQEGVDKKLENFEVEMRNVSFSYGNNKVINNVSFIAKQGEVTALVGPSGCGKTTILRLISRLYDYDSGMICIGGEDIKKISTESLFENISIVFQKVELFNNSILENIRIGRKDASDEEVILAAKLANVDKIVEKLPNGYHTVIGENGSKLSGGERQRISIARAFLKDAPIILLDEISASLDVENEMEIQNSINKLIKDKTVIIISHRLKSVEKADQIIVMNDGVIDSKGAHEEVLKLSEIYSAMIKKSELTDSYVY
ncbi:ABC transporter ATP-binding protein [Peptostreptococcus canis]|uniref:ABC transporter ATP-binding protein n=1 Tax=Peptostreptococcus canis TaxID=1159213 RepID=A0ABR6TKB9_9FIRM|nr:ABC transporter ATP-binding protein [Peptostreptococcus canis]MBC2575857.1 ABC transporter ATP-binding protein [Peptostreptococcus canis]MBP1998023.1 ATP-binding cassette subfamily B protein [Peptostreptococcus canis]